MILFTKKTPKYINLLPLGFVHVTVKVTIGHKCKQTETKSPPTHVLKKKKKSLNSLTELLPESLLCA